MSLQASVDLECSREEGPAKVPATINFSHELVEWAESAKYALTPSPITDDQRAIFWTNPGGEIRLFVGVSDSGWSTITSSERMGAEQFEFAARSQFVLERYLFGYFGEVIRGRLGLAELDIPAFEDEICAGFNITDIEFDGVSRRALVDPSGEAIAVGSLSVGNSTLVAMSTYVNSSIGDLEDSFQSPDGKPLFGLWEPPAEDPFPVASLMYSENVSEADVRELVGLIGDDEFVNGVAKDVIAYRRSREYPKPLIRRDETWNGYLYFFYVGDGYTKSSGFRYENTQSMIPLRVTEETDKRVEQVLARIRDAGDLPLERRWNAAAIVYDRARRSGDVFFFGGADAERWQMNPDNAGEIAVRGRELLDRVKER